MMVSSFSWTLSWSDLRLRISSTFAEASSTTSITVFFVMGFIR